MSENVAFISNLRRWGARAAVGSGAAFLFADALGKLLQVAPVVEGTARLGYSESVIVPLGALLLACTTLCALPRTSILGAILLTGYLGGAVATHVRVGDSVFSIVFPVMMATLMWYGMWLRDERLRALVPFRGH